MTGEALPGGKHLVARQILKTSDATDVKLKEKKLGPVIYQRHLKTNYSAKCETETREEV